MILEFTCSNHKSIKDNVTFSMLAGSDNTFEESLKEYSNLRVLRSAIIYGANGSGKSNFINALAFMCNLVSNSIKNQPGQEIFQVPHKLCSLETPSEYSIQFVKNDTRYAYGFSIIRNAVSDEYLYYFPMGRQVKIFERNGMEIKPGDRYKNAFDVSIGVLKENRLFLSCAANYTNIKAIEDAFIFFSNDIVVYNPNINSWTEYSIGLMQNSEMVKKVFVDMLQALGTGIKDVTWVEAKVVYDEFETDLMTEESAGIKKLFAMVCPIVDILASGKILIYDEFETSLHESVVCEIVRLFQGVQKDMFAQLIFSTHDTSLLDSNLFRRDQIWFAQLNSERATNLYSLAEIKNVRKTENLRKGYISGKYGAIPMLNKNFFELFGEETLYIKEESDVFQFEAIQPALKTLKISFVVP